jgi:hypothetical protein
MGEAIERGGAGCEIEGRTTEGGWVGRGTGRRTVIDEVAVAGRGVEEGGEGETGADRLFVPADRRREGALVEEAGFDLL